MDSKKTIELISKLIDVKLDKFYKNVIEPSIDKKIKEMMKSNKSIKESFEIDENSMLSLIDKESDDVKEQPIVNKVVKNPPKFNLGNKQISNILNTMANDSKNYGISRESAIGSYSQLMSEQYRDIKSNGEFDVSLPDDRSLESVQQEMTLQAGGNSEIAKMLVRDYSKVLKAVDKKVKSTRGES